MGPRSVVSDVGDCLLSWPQLLPHTHFFFSCGEGSWFRSVIARVEISGYGPVLYTALMERFAERIYVCGVIESGDWDGYEEFDFQWVAL